MASATAEFRELLAEGCQPSVAPLASLALRSTSVPGHEPQGAAPLRWQSHSPMLAYSK